MGAFTASSQALAESPTSAITKEGVAKEEAQAKSASRETRGAKPGESQGARNLSNNRSRPANQNGERLAPKYNSDIESLFKEIESGKNILDLLHNLEINK
jgi:hypothetical protein